MPLATLKSIQNFHGFNPNPPADAIVVDDGGGMNDLNGFWAVGPNSGEWHGLLQTVDISVFTDRVVVDENGSWTLDGGGALTGGDSTTTTAGNVAADVTGKPDLSGLPSDALILKAEMHITAAGSTDGLFGGFPQFTQKVGGGGSYNGGGSFNWGPTALVWTGGSVIPAPFAEYKTRAEVAASAIGYRWFAGTNESLTTLIGSVSVFFLRLTYVVPVDIGAQLQEEDDDLYISEANVNEAGIGGSSAVLIFKDDGDIPTDAVINSIQVKLQIRAAHADVTTVVSQTWGDFLAGVDWPTATDDFSTTGFEEIFSAEMPINPSTGVAWTFDDLYGDPIDPFGSLKGFQGWWALSAPGGTGGDPDEQVFDVEYAVLIVTYNESPTPDEATMPSSGDVGVEPLTWVEFTASDDSVYRWSKVGLPDRSSYYGGYKEARVTEFGRITRGLSDFLGAYESASFSFTLDDTDRVIRGLLAGALTKFFPNRSIVARAITDPQRRQELTPLTIMRGKVSNYRPLSDLRFEMNAEDVITRQFVFTQANQKQVPKRTIGVTDFPDVDPFSLGLGVPIIYGSVTSGIADPEPVTDAVLNVVAVPIGQLGSAPTGFTYATVPASSDNHYYDYVHFYALSAVFDGPNGTGPSGDETPLAILGPAFGTIDATNLLLSWDAVVGATELRLYRGNLNSSFRQFDMLKLDPSATSFEEKWSNYDTSYTDQYTFPDVPWELGIRVTFDYSVYALVAAGLYSQPGEARIEFTPLRSADGQNATDNERKRRVTLTWDAFPGALGYRIIRHRFDYTDWNPVYNREWDVDGATLTLIDEQLDVTPVSDPALGGPTIDVTNYGRVPAIYVGTEDMGGGVIYQRYLLAGHAVKLIRKVNFSSETIGGPVEGDVTYTRVADSAWGVSWFAPGKPGYPGGLKYRDIGGNRYALIYTTLSPPPATILVDVDGIEDAGDGTGTLITDVLGQYLHCLQNFVFGSYTSGAWLATPTFSDDPSVPQILNSSFVQASAIALTRLSIGYQGAGVIGASGKLLTVRDLIQRFNQSCDVDSGFNRKCQFFVSMIDDSGAALAAAPNVTQVADIRVGSFDITDDLDSHWNVIPYRYQQDYAPIRTGKSDWLFSSEIRSDDSITNYQAELSMPTLDMYFIRAGIVADDIAQRKLQRHKDPPRKVMFGLALVGYNYDLGDILLVTHQAGISPTGWVARPVRVMRHAADPGKFSVDFTCLDMDRVFTSSFILGDETALPDDWSDATEAERRYGYLADETTGVFSDGADGKRLR